MSEVQGGRQEKSEWLEEWAREQEPYVEGEGEDENG